MANKNQIERYIIIDRMLTNPYRQFPTRREIMRECEQVTGFSYSQSAFEKDLRAMRDRYGASIQYDKNKNGYCYEDPNYRFLKVDLSQHDKVLIELTKALLGAGSSNVFMPFYESVEKVLEVDQQLEQEHNSLTNLVQLDRTAYFSTSEVLSDFIKALKESYQIRFVYTKFVGDSRESRTLHPYLLKEFKGRWFVTGWCPNAKAIRTFGLDRISDTDIIEEKIYPANEAGFDAKAYYQHVYGITHENNPPVEVLLRFTPLQAKYVKTQPLHHSQEIVSDDSEGCIVKLFLVPNPDFRIQLLSYGAEVQVLQPESLRQEIKVRLQKALDLYA